MIKEEFVILTTIKSKFQSGVNLGKNLSEKQKGGKTI